MDTVNGGQVPQQMGDGSALTGEPLLAFAAAALLVAIVLAVHVVRAVPRHRRLVVAGRSRNRVLGPGLVAVWPPAARTLDVPVLPRELPVTELAAVTADGLPVTVDATVTARVVDAALFAGPAGTPAGSAWAAVDDAVEAAVLRHVAEHDLAALAGATPTALPATAAVELAEQRGIELGQVELRDVTVAVDEQLARWAANPRPRPAEDDDGEDVNDVEIHSTTVPGRGVLHVCRTRRGGRIGVLVERSGTRTLLSYGSEAGLDPDRAALEVLLDADEADQLADLLQSRPLPERLEALERTVTAMGSALAGMRT